MWFISWFSCLLLSSVDQLLAHKFHRAKATLPVSWKVHATIWLGRYNLCVYCSNPPLWCSLLLLFFALAAHSNGDRNCFLPNPQVFSQVLSMICRLLPWFCTCKVLSRFSPGICLYRARANTINNPRQWEDSLTLFLSCYKTRQRLLKKRYDHGLLLQPNATVARSRPKLCANAILDQNENQTW